MPPQALLPGPLVGWGVVAFVFAAIMIYTWWSNRG